MPAEVKTTLSENEIMICQAIESLCPRCGNIVKFQFPPRDIDWESAFRESRRINDRLRQTIYDLGIENKKLKGELPP